MTILRSSEGQIASPKVTLRYAVKTHAQTDSIAISGQWVIALHRPYGRLGAAALATTDPVEGAQQMIMAERGRLYRVVFEQPTSTNTFPHVRSGHRDRGASSDLIQTPQ